MAKEKSKAAGKTRAKARKPQGDVRVGPKFKKACRVPINVAESAKKAAKVTQLEIKVGKLQKSMAPTKAEITKLNKEIDKLCADVDSNTEEQEIWVKEEVDFKHKEVRILHAGTGEVIETRTMSPEDRQLDVEDAGRGKKAKPAKETDPNQEFLARRATEKGDGLDAAAVAERELREHYDDGEPGAEA